MANGPTVRYFKMQLKPIKITVNDTPFVVWESPITLNELIDLANIKMSDEWRQGEGLDTFNISSGMSFTLTKNDP